MFEREEVLRVSSKEMDALMEKIRVFIDQYSDYYEKANEKGDYTNPFREIIKKDIPDLLRDCAGLSEPYLVEGSYGKGKWPIVPWIAIMDKRITDTATKGVYIVYLLNKDSKTLYLSFVQAEKEIEEIKTKKKLRLLKESAQKIREELDTKDFIYDDTIYTGKPGYDAGTIVFKKYTLDILPTGDEFIRDLNSMLAIYAKYKELKDNKILPVHEERNSSSWLLTWNPANYDYSEYEDKRQEVIEGKKYIEQWACSNSHVQIGDRIYLMRIGAGNRNGIIASGHAVKTSYDAPHYDLVKAAEGIKIKKIDVEFDCLLDRNGTEFLRQKDLSHLFPDQQWSPQASGIEIKKEYCEGLEREWDKFREAINTEQTEPMQISVAEAINSIKGYIASEGFTYSPGLIENFYLSLKSKPFVILAGTSGTGKTKLVRLFAEAIGAEYKMISVRPDWSDSSDLFGHVDLNGDFIAGPALEFICDAQRHLNKPFILCLDEMNLARVEYYFSDFLSIIETRSLKGKSIESDCLLSNEKYGKDEYARKKYGEIRFPENLYIVGTVNMDETTFPFSKKVLDRANTIEFNTVELMPIAIDKTDYKPMSLPNEFLKARFVILSQVDNEEYVRTVCEKLQVMNSTLQEANVHIGYRIRDEIVFYMINNFQYGLLSDDEAFDNEVMQKILPRIQGSSMAIKEMLCNLFGEMIGDYDGLQAHNNDIAKKMFNQIKDDCKYRKSAEKIAFMVRRFEEDGFTSYWL